MTTELTCKHLEYFKKYKKMIDESIHEQYTRDEVVQLIDAIQHYTPIMEDYSD